VREQAQASAASIEEFLESLQMTARVRPIDSATVERSAQLIARSNQFNLTTRRRSTAEILAMTGDDSWITFTVTLADRYGDYGLISVVLARVREDTVEIDTWLMSCRVLKRTVEDLVLNHLAEEARRRGRRLLHGDYIPTPKNDLVREHYPRLGFQPAGTDASGSTRWNLPIADGWQPRRHFISLTAGE